MTMTFGREELLAPVLHFPFRWSIPTSPMLILDHVTKRYGATTALNDISLSVAPGECFGLLGPNGAGKSTLMALAAGLRAPDEGRILLNGQSISVAHPSTRGALGLVPQSIALYEDLSAEQNLRIFGELYGLRGRELQERIQEALEAVQLVDRRHDQVKVFSGGMQRRLNLVAAILHRPKLLLCDEPTVGVDPQSRNAIFDFLEARVRDGLTVIYSTHYMEEATRLCSRIGIIDHGKIHALGTLDELLAQLPFNDEISFPASPATAGLAARLVGHGEIIPDEGAYRFHPAPGFKTSTFYAWSEEFGLSSRLFVIERPSLEAVFLHLTGRTLRE